MKRSDFHKDNERITYLLFHWSRWNHEYLKHEDERKVKAQGFHQYLKEECGEKQFAEKVARRNGKFDMF